MRLPSIQVGDQPARDGQDQGHVHVGSILGEDARRIGHGHAARNRRADVDIVDAIAEIGDQFQLRTGSFDQGGIDPIRHGRHQHVSRVHGLHKFRLRQWLVVYIETRVEQFAHPRFDDVGQFACDDDERFLSAHSLSAFGQPRLRTTSPSASTIPDRPPQSQSTNGRSLSTDFFVKIRRHFG
jgi:hypothetical protein